MDFRWISVCRVELCQDWFLVLILPEKAARLNWGPKLSHINLGVRPVGFDLSFQLGTVSPQSVWGLCPARIHRGWSLTQVLRRPNQITNTSLPQSTATGLPCRHGSNGYSNIQEPSRGKCEDGGRCGQREEQKLGVGRESHCCKRGDNVI